MFYGKVEDEGIIHSTCLFPTSPLLKCRQAKFRHCLANDYFQSSCFVRSLHFKPSHSCNGPTVPSHSTYRFRKVGELAALRKPDVGSQSLGEQAGQPAEPTGRVASISVKVLLAGHRSVGAPSVPGPALC